MREYHFYNKDVPSFLPMLDSNKHMKTYVCVSARLVVAYEYAALRALSRHRGRARPRSFRIGFFRRLGCVSRSRAPYSVVDAFGSSGTYRAPPRLSFHPLKPSPNKNNRDPHSTKEKHTKRVPRDYAVCFCHHFRHPAFPIVLGKSVARRLRVGFTRGARKHYVLCPCGKQSAFYQWQRRHC